MRDYLTLGPTPAEEPCAQVGTPDYMRRTRIETSAYIDQLIRRFGQPPGLSLFRVKRFPHEFGDYHEVVITYDDEVEDSVDFAFNVENNLPGEWDEQAKAVLLAQHYHLHVVQQPVPPVRRTVDQRRAITGQ